MIIICIGIVYLLGFSIVLLVSRESIYKDLSVHEVIGISFLIGIGMETVFMFLFDIIHLHINAYSLSFVSLLSISSIFYYQRDSLILNFQRIKQFSFRWKIRGANIAWIFIFILIIIALTVSIMKSLFWPTVAYDSVAGYDLMAKVIALEGKLKVSLFALSSAGPRAIYPPLVEGSFAYAYLFGISSSKIITSLTYISLLLVFYGLLRKYTTGLSSILLTLLLMASPEMYSHSSFSLSNLPGATYAALGLLYLFRWCESQDRNMLLFGSILLGMNVWTRNDGIVFNISGLILVGYYALKNSNWNDLILYCSFAFVPFIIWGLYLKYKIGIMPDRFVDHLFWDAKRFSILIKWIQLLVLSRNYYGLTFYFFFITLLLNFRNIYRDKFQLLLLILIAFIMYSAIFYQLDETKQDVLSKMMSASFKRGLFCFIPLVLFYVGVSTPMQLFFSKIEKYSIGKA